MIKLVVGLGNPGDKYSNTRHNFGFMVLDGIIQRCVVGSLVQRFQGLHGNYGGIHFLKPQTYMNNSGQAVGEIMRFYRIQPEQLLVLHDELDIALGEVRYKQGGGDAGHRGLISITNMLGNNSNYHRLRLGISRPVDKGQVSSYVLQPFTEAERTIAERVRHSVTENSSELLSGAWLNFSESMRRLRDIPVQ